MIIKPPRDIAPGEITPETVYRDRRRFLASGIGLAGAALSLPVFSAMLPAPGEPPFVGFAKSPLSTEEAQTPFDYAEQVAHLYTGMDPKTYF